MAVAHVLTRADDARAGMPTATPKYVLLPNDWEPTWADRQIAKAMAYRSAHELNLPCTPDVRMVADWDQDLTAVGQLRLSLRGLQTPPHGNAFKSDVLGWLIPSAPRRVYLRVRQDAEQLRDTVAHELKHIDQVLEHGRLYVALNQDAAEREAADFASWAVKRLT